MSCQDFSFDGCDFVFESGIMCILECSNTSGCSEVSIQ